MTRFAQTWGKPLRLMVLLGGAGLICMAVFALVPLLLRQTSFQPHFPNLSYALLIPVRPETPPPDIQRPDETPRIPPEAPKPPEPELDVKLPDAPDVKPPELVPPENAPREVTRETLDTAPVEASVFPSPTPDLPELQTPSLNALSLDSLPTKSSPLNLKVNLKVGKVPVPGVIARPAVPPKPTLAKARFGMDEVDQKPVGIATLKPPYPFRARRMGIEGYVTVQFLVDQKGSPRELSIVEAKPKGVFDQTVRQTVPRWRFKPGKKAGRPVETWVEITIRFELGHNG